MNRLRLIGGFRFLFDRLWFHAGPTSRRRIDDGPFAARRGLARFGLSEF
jgi:hypothetical protein